MGKRIAALIFIFVCTSIAWFVLGGTMSFRTQEQDSTLSNDVSNLWGKVQRQEAPSLICVDTEGSRTPVTFDRSNIDVNLDLEHRKKGLLWYSTYKVAFGGDYRFSNSTAETREFIFRYTFPCAGGIYDSFNITLGGQAVRDISLDQEVVQQSIVQRSITLAPGESAAAHVSYRSQGMNQWWYEFGKQISQVRNFDLTLTTNFDGINFPENSMSPTQRSEINGGWKLAWHYDNLLSGIQIGMEMPQKLNPGPFVSRVSFFAPVSLFLFFFLMFVITTIRDIRIHPMNYFFLAAAFFSFHLLLAYLVDHVDIHVAMLISSLTSMFLVISYMRLVTGTRFALFETGLSLLVYLVLFSYAFFLEGYTGLTITICCIVTLSVVMLATGRIDWEKKFLASKPHS
jgi:inner membrane protein involved in colicin E2 resistance